MGSTGYLIPPHSLTRTRRQPCYSENGVDYPASLCGSLNMSFSLMARLPLPLVGLSVFLWGLTWSCLPLGAQSAPSSAAPTLVSPASQLDYKQLQQALIAQDFQRANELTRLALLEAANRQTQGWLSSEDFRRIPCPDLQIMDRLWRTHSQNRFGFSVQYEIFVKTGNRPGRLISSDAYEKFGDQVGWRKNGQWTIFKQNLDYSLNAAPGHLPNARDEYQINGGRLEYTALTERLQACQLTGATPSPKTKK